MKSVNLIPTPRRDAKRRRRQLNACIATCGGFALALLCAVAGIHALWGGAAEALDRDLVTVAQDVQRLEKQTADARAELTIARATIEANRTVAEQPDWSVLLGLLSQTIERDIVLRSVSIAPPFVPSTAGPVAAAPVKVIPDVVLELTGVGRTQLAVSQHVLRLEQTGLFSKVALIDTGRENYMRNPAIAFRLQCTFGDARQTRVPEPKPAAAPTARPALSAVDTGGTAQ